uniref:Pru domain-containing protein n=1 Tax=Rhabditophanes sp. KR3021 TaxID=114890 RepID=A0AC35UH53_9BILA
MPSQTPSKDVSSKPSTNSLISVPTTNSLNTPLVSRLITLKNSKKANKKFVLFHESPTVIRKNRMMFLIKAGRSTFTKNAGANTGHIECDKRPGYLRMKVDERGALNIMWENNSTRKKELQIKTVPNEYTVYKINECKDGHVIMLKGHTNDVRQFFWIQDCDSLEQCVPKMNRILQMR